MDIKELTPGQKVYRIAESLGLILEYTYLDSYIFMTETGMNINLNQSDVYFLQPTRELAELKLLSKRLDSINKQIRDANESLQALSIRKCELESTLLPFKDKYPEEFI